MAQGMRMKQVEMPSFNMAWPMEKPRICPSIFDWASLTKIYSRPETATEQLKGIRKKNLEEKKASFLQLWKEEEKVNAEKSSFQDWSYYRLPETAVLR